MLFFFEKGKKKKKYQSDIVFFDHSPNPVKTNRLDRRPS